MSKLAIFTIITIQTYVDKMSIYELHTDSTLPARNIEADLQERAS